MESGPPREGDPAGPGPHSPAGPQSPAPQPQPQPSGTYPPQPGPEGPPGGYTGPVPPGGWQTPAAPPPQPWAGAPLATWGSRLGAWLIDFLVLAVPALILFFVIVAGAVGISGDEDVAVGAAIAAFILWFLAIAAIGLLYAPLLMARQGANNGRTWGKQMLGLRVVRDDGQTIGFGWAALREIVLKNLAVGIASSIIPVIPWLLNYFWPLWDDENRALHDMAVKSHVLRA